MISLEHKCVYIHIPKCAGSTIESIFLGSDYIEWDEDNKIWQQHATAQQIKKLYCNDYDDYFSFTFVRNPWDRALSDYIWMQKELKIEDTFKNYLLLEGAFDNERLKYPPTSRETRHDHLLSQCDFVLDSEGISMVNYIGRFETLQQDFNTVCDMMNIPQQQLPHVNKTDHKHYTEYYDDETRQLVAEKYSNDIEYFDYTFV